MPQLKIVLYGDPVLRLNSEPIDEVTDELKDFIEGMFATLKRANGIGLSAPQVGVNKRFFVLDLSAVSLEIDKLVLINPRIISEKGTQTGEEGCLSFPGLFLEVTRADEIECEYTGLDGEDYTIKVNDLLSRAIQHELDHLNGKLFIDHISPGDRDLISGKLKKIKSQVLA